MPESTGATFATVLRRAELVAAEREAVVCGDVRLSHRELGRRCRGLAAGLRRLGLVDGDRVAVVGPNCHRYLELYLAVPASRLVLVPLNARHTDGELRAALIDAGARVLFCGGGRDTSGLAGAVERIITLPEGYDELLEHGDGERALAADEDRSLAGLFYTGGTTGASKGVMLSHRNLIANAGHFMSCWRFEPSTRWLVAAPMFHLAGTIAVLACVWSGGTQVVQPAFDPRAALTLIEAERVTATLLVPTMLAALADEQLEHPRDASSLAGLSHGGSPAATETLHRAHRAFPQAELLHIYGATETAPIVTLLPHEERVLDAPQTGSCGQPAIGVEVRIERPDTHGIGEVAARGPNVMLGYWGRSTTTAEVLSDDGWYRTGDLGRLDRDGYLHLVDRAKDMIVTGGENVYSTEVEEALYAHPAVLEAAVFGIPDDRWGEAVHAIVVPRAPVSADELLEHCRTRLADYKLPKAIELRNDPLPKSGAGKLLKRELREPYWADRAGHVAGA